MDNRLDPSISNKILDSLPMGVIVFSDAKIHWVNSWLLERLQTSLDCLAGLSGTEAIETEFAALFGNDETLRLTDSNKQIIWFYREKSASDGYEVHYFQDITSLMQVIEERKQLRLKLAEQQTKTPATGLLNEAAVLQALDLQVSRSRRYLNPLSVIELSISMKNDTPCDKRQIQTIGNLLKDQLRWADQVGLLNENSFLILLPETAKTDAQQLIEKLLRAEESPLAPESEIAPQFKVEEWVKGDDSRKLLKRLKESKPIPSPSN